MRSRYTVTLLSVFAGAGLMFGCGGGDDDAASSGGALPQFSLAWSEYPSWSVFGVAEEKGLIDGDAGKTGSVEEKWGVDIVLNQVDYDACLTLFAGGTVDAVCITNMDVLNPALSRESAAILPTSTSAGADALIVTPAINTIADLKGKKVYGLSKSVSEYTFVRNLEKLGESEADYTFTNKDPAAAALAMQTEQAGYDAIVVWNPFVMQTLRSRPETKVLFDSAAIPGEIIDMVAVAQESLAKPGGREFALAIIDAFYQVNDMIADPETGDETLIALGAKFSNLGLDDMKNVVIQTAFYKTPEEAIGLLTGSELPETMTTVVKFCLDHEIIGSDVNVAYGAVETAEGAHLRFDPTYIQEFASQN